MVLHVLGVLSLLVVALLFGATWYETVIMAPNYERDVPASITLARQFLVRTPAVYFRPLAPLAQILTLLCVVFSWGRAGFGTFLAAFLILILADIITFTYHYPRLALMFKTDAPVEPDRLRRAAREWGRGNIVRGVLLLLVLLAVLGGLHHARLAV